MEEAGPPLLVERHGTGCSQGRGSPRIGRRALAAGHTLFLMAVFLPPFVLCLTLASSVDVAFFVGRRSLTPCVVVPVVIVLVPLLHWCVRPKRLSFYNFTVLIPAIALAIVGLTLKGHTDSASYGMMQRDCFGFPEKRALYHAYERASRTFDECGSPHEGLQWCGNYHHLEAPLAREFGYLENLEWRFPCAGICRRGRRLWKGAGDLGPACGVFVAQWLKGASIQATIVFWYNLVVVILAGPVGSMVMRPFLHHCE